MYKFPILETVYSVNNKEEPLFENLDTLLKESAHVPLVLKGKEIGYSHDCQIMRSEGSDILRIRLTFVLTGRLDGMVVNLKPTTIVHRIGGKLLYRLLTHFEIITNRSNTNAP
ncbi:hypothetical protein HYP05_gp106 [Salmonella phage ST-W77]|uniref:Uncharacterized protein n=10 Tax=Caudoviricetes TaxID=2731619 RepID=A0A1W5PUS2_9CAUD|nr:hypothetical protein SFP_0073 [Salmonella phage SFP10]YP_009283887.1 hypothetical protein BI169_gp098 [Salmonella phage GG32]YP_009876111.1 hypothetical protein HYP05_gp106 [Salmonella phage ST-W77]YP_009888016.1 hypothetical protein HYQ32_gp102 [Salmonella phage bering]YP_009888828.1 hypothetical protein HYQ36_gp105 [Salmonella phage moki]ANT44545.1 hypothetical protein vB_SenM-2_086 [Salmonella phage vB_SenM-2]APD18380.1 hypothetical protein STP07_113 [Salmonella phage STP07]AXC40785.1 